MSALKSEDLLRCHINTMPMRCLVLLKQLQLTGFANIDRQYFFIIKSFPQLFNCCFLRGEGQI